MLCGTYQPFQAALDLNAPGLEFLAQLKESYARFGEIERGGEIWAFPVGKGSDAVLHSILTAPPNPHVFMLIDAKNPVRLDRFAHYRDILKGDAPADHDGIAARYRNDDIDDDLCEIMLDSSEIADAVALAVIPADPGLLVKDGLFFVKRGDGFANVRMTPSRDMEGLIRKSSGMLDRMIPDIKNIEENLNGAALELLRMKFALSVLQGFCDLALSGKMGDNDHGHSETGLAPYAFLRSLVDRYNAIGQWARNPEDPEECRRIISGIREILSVPDDLIIRVIKGKPGRNDPCPCGSGKKYKKCHLSLFE